MLLGDCGGERGCIGARCMVFGGVIERLGAGSGSKQASPEAPITCTEHELDDKPWIKDPLKEHAIAISKRKKADQEEQRRRVQEAQKQEQMMQMMAVCVAGHLRHTPQP